MTNGGTVDDWRLGDHRVLDGTLSLVTDPFVQYPMGATAEKVAERYGVSRDDQDRFALRSQERALRAIAAGEFIEEIVPLTPPRAEAPFATDEHPRETTIEQLGKLRPAFHDGGTVTAGNSSGINDGAAALVMMRRSEARRRSIEPRLELRAWAVAGIDPEVMGYAPAFAIPRALERAGLGVDEIDHVELNEAFAAQAASRTTATNLDEEKVNPSGGAIAFGHPG
jgi:acetyl-CoA C-acetyltransferase